jgi:hypothetical protein
MSVSSIAIVIGLVLGVVGLAACIIVACTHRGLNPMKISLIVMSVGGFIWIIGQALATAAENPPKFALRCSLPG